MNYPHIISDIALTFCAFYVFFRFMSKLNLSNAILWESFVLSVGAAALFGAIRYAGYDNAGLLSMFFQQIAAITGGVGLAGAAFGLVMDVKFSKLACYFILSVGFLLFAIAEGFNISALSKWVPIIAMCLVVVFAVLGMFNNKKIASFWLIMAVLLFALGVFRNQIFGKEEYVVDVFHFLTAAGLLSLGMAAGQTSKEI